MTRRVLYVMHNHPSVRPGGAESYALELHQGMRASPEYEPVLVSRIGPGAPEGVEGSGDVSIYPPRHAGAPFSIVEGEDPNQYFLLTEYEGNDFFFRTYRDKSLYTTYIADFLRTFKPDVVHFQHTNFIGYDVITLVRRVLPQVPIVYTLHDYLPICHREGQMVRTGTEELCSHASPRRCNKCYPDWSQQNFFLRERVIKSHLLNVDMFLAPSMFLLERYADWGIPREKLRFEEYGRLPQTNVDAPGEDRPRNRLGFFGQITPFKGVEVLLDAMQILLERAPDVHVFLHGTNLDTVPDEARLSILDALDRIGANVTIAGPYEAQQVPWLMSRIDWVVVPSRWWENSPLVIQEAFMHGRPVICSDIGAMTEKVTNNVNGLHFTVSSPAALAETILRAVGTPGLWNELRGGIQPVYSMDKHVASLTALYDELVDRRCVPDAEREPLIGAVR